MFSPIGGGFDAMFTIVPMIVAIGFVVVIGLIIYRVIQGGIEWNRNNHSPVLSVDAKVVGKRMAVSHHHHNHVNNAAMSHHSSSTTYFATFEVQSGDRVELRLPDKEYGMLVESDKGILTFQGTRYKGFERNKKNR